MPAADWTALVAPSICAPLIVAYASFVAQQVSPIRRKVPNRDMNSSGAHGGMRPVEEEEEEEDAGIVQVTVVGAFCFVIVASIFLVLLFFFQKYFFYVLRGLYGFGGLFAVYSMVVPYVDGIFTTKLGCNVPCLGRVTVPQTALFVACLGLVVAWAFTNDWEGNFMLQNIISLAQCVLIISVYNLSSMKVSALLLVLAFFFDIFWVFLSAKIFGESVMIHVATGGGGTPLPMLLRFGSDATTSPILGLGDIVLPGLFISYNLKYDYYKSGSAANGYFYAQLVAYTAGIVSAFTVAYLYAGQPALMYIVPSCLVTGVTMALIRGDLREFWQGPDPDSELMTKLVDPTSDRDGGQSKKLLPAGADSGADEEKGAARDL